MGFWSKVKKGIAVATTIAPMLPIPAKAKRVIAKVGETEEDVEAIVHEVKPAKPAAKTILPMLALLLLASPAFAQQPIPTDYTLSAHLEANPNGAPISTYDFPKSAAQCDQPVVAVTGVQANPRYIRWTDPERPTRDCVLDTGTTSGVLFAMPFGGRYVAKLVAKTVAGGVEFASLPSVVSNPFVRGAAPAPAVAVRVGG